jgi:hypothetical protein
VWWLPYQSREGWGRETGPVWARHVEKKKMGGPAMHMLEQGGRQRRTPNGGGRWSGQGRFARVRHGEKEKNSVWAAPGGRLMGRLLWVGPKWIVASPIYSNKISNDIDLIQSKDELVEFKKNQIKYGFEGFELRNNFTYWNFSKFRIEFEFKIQGSSRVWNSMKFGWMWLKISIIDETEQGALVCTWMIKSTPKETWNFNFCDFSRFTPRIWFKFIWIWLWAI